MPVWLSFFGAIVGTVGFFAVLFGTVIFLIEGRRAKAKPRLGIAPGDRPGTLGIWTAWDPAVFNVQVYRIRIFHTSPEYKLKEGQFTVTFDPPQKAPFFQIVELPPSVKELLEVGVVAKNALITVEVKTAEELALWKSYTLAKVRKVYHGRGGKAPAGLAQLKAAPPDVPAVTSLDYQELVTRKKKLRDLEAAAKAKAAAKTAPKPAAAAPKAGEETTAAGKATPKPAAQTVE